MQREMALNWSIAVLIAFIQMCVGTPWATPAQEALDERNDAAIFRAVLTSMEAWQKRAVMTHSRTLSRKRRAESQVCYEGLGCYQDSGPFGYLDMLPASPDEVGTRFLLYASHADTATAVDVPFANITQVWTWAEKSFNSSAPTKVIVHGFGSDCDHVWVYEMKSALMAVEPCNVICVDWGSGAAVPNYVKASANTRLVGKQVALLLDGLRTRGLDLDSTHVIGFSLGAHVAGFAGAQLKNLSRITGLDPAGPLFESQDPRARLDSTDANFVDVIHSNGENLILGGLGSWQPMGHVDFYPNGGRMQKGCSNLFVGAFTDILWSNEIEGRSLCNHRRAYKFFTDSLSPRCHFPAFPCESYDKFLEGGCFPCAGDKRCGNMGYYADKSTVRGTLYLITRDEEPFCAHQYHVRVESAPTAQPTVSYGKISVTLVGSADINETFTLTSKDDAEIRVGVPLTRIAVPHPAMQEPRAVQLTYTAYSGWLSSGLQRWGVDKLMLTDSFGKSLSVCKKGLMLETGVPVTLPLYPGECNPPRDAANATASPPLNKTSPSSSFLDIFRYKPTPVVQIGDEVVPKIPETSPLIQLLPAKAEQNEASESAVSETLLDVAGETALTGKPWKPVSFDDKKGNGLIEKDLHEDSRAFSDDSKVSNTNQSVVRPEIKEPILLSTTSRNNVMWSEDSTNKTSAFRPRTITVREEHKEILEPILNPTTHRPKRTDSWMPKLDLNPPSKSPGWSWNRRDDAQLAEESKSNITKTRIGKQITIIQLFPQRLATILSQAERFARQQFSPRKTENQTVNNTEAEEAPVQRKPKYFSNLQASFHSPTEFIKSIFNFNGGSNSSSQDAASSKVNVTANDSADSNVLVPYSYRANNRNDRQYIPLKYPDITDQEPR